MPTRHTRTSNHSSQVRKQVTGMLEKAQEKFDRLGMGKRKLKMLIVFFLFFVLVYIFAVTQSQYRNFRLAVGEVATEDIKAPFEIVDEESYQQEVARALEDMEPVYRISPTVQISSKAKVSGYLDLVRETKLKNNMTTGLKITELVEKSPLEADETLHRISLESSFSQLNTVEAITIDLLSQMLAQGIREEDHKDQIADLDGIVNSLNLSEDESILISAMLREAIQPNEFVDTIATERQMDRIRSSIIRPVIQQNEVIVHKGDTITSEHMRIIRLADLENTTNRSWTRYIGMAVHLLIPLGGFFLYLLYFYPILLEGRLVYLVISSMLLTLVLGKALDLISPYLIPSALNIILVSLLVGSRVAMATNLVLVWIISFMFGIPSELTAIMIMSNSLGVLLLARQSQRHRVLLNGIYMSAISFITYSGYYLLGNITPRELLVNGGFLMGAGVLSGIVALGTLPVWEYFFKVLTPIKLMELTDPNQPLLRRLFAEAPGTYHHSLLVGSLVEAAASAIGANQLLAKAGAYYHDIGKLKRPSYFKENQFGTENPHDQMEPMQSSEIIISHWEDGMKLGRESKLPKEILDIIDQHHGNTLMAYFYHKASKENGKIPEEPFRYGGNKPRTREAAIVMLADSVEAAVRSLKIMNEETIEEMVRKIIRGKIDEGQLDECPMTTREISMVTETFLSVLKGIYHERIEYPEKTI